MYQGNWTCSSCGGDITELPFQPRSTANLLCRSCHAKQREQNGGGASANGERKMFEGNWTCADCGTAITKLPFQPRGDTSNLRCLDCYKKARS